MTSNKVLLVVAGLSGAIGVTLSAVAAHHADLPNLGTAANMLLFHAPVFLVLSLASSNRARRIAGFALVAGLMLFVGDLLARAYLGSRLFPMAAPTGGILLIAGWLGVAASGFLKDDRQSHSA